MDAILFSVAFLLGVGLTATIQRLKDSNTIAGFAIEVAQALGTCAVAGLIAAVALRFLEAAIH